MSLTKVSGDVIQDSIVISGVITATNLTSSGISTFPNVVVGGATTALVVTGNARITGILTVGTSSLTFDGNTDTVRIGTGVTIQSGIVSATSYFASNSKRVIALDSGIKTLFFEATAPTGWTKLTTHNDKALRVVSGTGGGSGGSTAFSTVMTSRTPGGSVSGTNSSGAVSNTTLSEAQMPSHQHGTTFNGADDTNPPRNVGNMTVWADNAPFSGTAYSDYRGSSNSHGHGFTNPTWSGSFTGTAMDFAIQYVDMILCSVD